MKFLNNNDITYCCKENVVLILYRLLETNHFKKKPASRLSRFLFPPPLPQHPLHAPFLLAPISVHSSKLHRNFQKLSAIRMSQAATKSRIHINKNVNHNFWAKLRKIHSKCAKFFRSFASYFTFFLSYLHHNKRTMTVPAKRSARAAATFIQQEVIQKVYVFQLQNWFVGNQSFSHQKKKRFSRYNKN